VIGAGLVTAALFAHAQHLRWPAGFPHAAAYRSVYAGAIVVGGVHAMRLASGGALRGYRMRVASPERQARPFNRYDVAAQAVYPPRGGPTWYSGGITPVSAQARPAPHPPSADTPVRAGSIREDVARYNEERSTFRSFARGGAGVPHPPMPSPYRN